MGKREKKNRSNVSEKRDIFKRTLLKALNNAKGCFFCELENDYIFRYFTGLLHEHVNNSGVRKELEESRGYCHRHAHYLLTFRDGLGVANIYKDQVKAFIGFISETKGPGKKPLIARGSSDWTDNDKCPACKYIEGIRRRNEKTLIEGLKEETMREALDLNPSLCVPHFSSVIKSLKDSRKRKFLKGVFGKKLKALMVELEEFTRKQDHRFTDDQFGNERDSWIRVVDIMTGKEGLF